MLTKHVATNLMAHVTQKENNSVLEALVKLAKKQEEEPGKEERQEMHNNLYKISSKAQVEEEGCPATVKKRIKVATPQQQRPLRLCHTKSSTVAAT